MHKHFSCSSRVKQQPWMHSQVCSQLSFGHSGFHSWNRKRHSERALHNNSLWIQWLGKGNLQGNLLRCIKPLSHQFLLYPYTKKDWARVFRISSIRQEFKSQAPLCSSGMLLANPGLEEFSLYPPKASLSPHPGDLLLSLFQTMSWGICWASSSL